MKSCGDACGRRDLVCGRTAFVLWCIPSFVIAVGLFLLSVRALLWIPSFTLMGGACVVNARGCGRLHCYLTGPLFLLAAIVTLLDAVAIIDVSPIVMLTSVGIGTALAYGLEWCRGKYVATSV
jgi:hypothetical protein